jgi:hypothetical protein
MKEKIIGPSKVKKSEETKFNIKLVLSLGNKSVFKTSGT